MSEEQHIKSTKAAKAVAAFRKQYGVDACEDRPAQYFKAMHDAFGGLPSEVEVWQIEELSFQHRS
jgi:hypothetical protein